jgi:phosphatidylglycerophosphate synthase
MQTPAAPPDPWDSRLARKLVEPLRATRVHPNHLTTAALLVGLAAAALFARGTSFAVAVGGVLFVLSSLLDHADGELARLAGKSTAFGRTYDRLSDLAVRLASFCGLGIGASGGWLGVWPAVAGLSAGVALVAIFSMRSALSRRRGSVALQQPSVAGYDLEDVLYVIGPIAWWGLAGPCVILAGIGTPGVALWWLANGCRAAGGRADLGVASFVGIIVWQGVGEVAAALGAAGAGLLVVAAFHLVPRCGRARLVGSSRAREAAARTNRL